MTNKKDNYIRIQWAAASHRRQHTYSYTALHVRVQSVLDFMLISSATLFSYAQHVACSLFLNYTVFYCNIQSKKCRRNTHFWQLSMTLRSRIKWAVIVARPPFWIPRRNKRALREYWMIYRGPGFLEWFGSSSTPLPTPLSVSTLSPFLSLSVCRRSSFLSGGGGGEPNHTTVKKLLYKSLNTLWGHRSTLLAELTDSLIWSPPVMKAVQGLYLHNSYRRSVFFCMDPEVFFTGFEMSKQNPGTQQ